MSKRILLREIASTLQTKRAREEIGSSSWRNKPLWDWGKNEIEEFCSGVKPAPPIFPLGATDKEKIAILQRDIEKYKVLSDEAGDWLKEKPKV